jgi:hypothetical protein
VSPSVSSTDEIHYSLPFQAKGEAMKRFITVTSITLALALRAFADTNNIVVPLTYTGRSTESSGSIAYGTSLGSEVSAALALPLNPSQTIFDGGVYHSEDIAPTGVVWASWPIYNPSNGGSFQARHFQATFVLPVGLSNIVGLTLFSPYYTAAGNYVIVDDNSYFYLNGSFIGDKGTSYGASNGPLSIPSLQIHETNGWHQDGSFGSAPLAFLHSGTNTLDIVEEDTGGGGSTGPLNVLLLQAVPEPTTVFLVASAIPLLFCLQRKRTC